MSLAGYNLSPQAAAKEAMWAAQRTQSVVQFVRPTAGASYPTSGPTNVNGRDMFADDWWANITSMSSADRAEAAAKVSAVYFCCSLIAVIVGSLPREFRGSDGKHDPAMPISELVVDSPNRLQTGDEFWSSMAFRAALAGVSFAEPVPSVFGGVEMWPLTPVRTEVDWEDRDFEIRYSPERGPVRVLRPQDVFWFAGLADSTSRPLTPWRMAKGSIDFALALESQGRDFFTNGARLAGLLTTEDKLTDEAIARLKASIAGWRSGKIPVLEQGLTFKDVASNNTDSQLAELIKQRTLELARYWHIPKSLTGEESGAKANHEQEALDLVKYVVRPWTRRIEQAVRQRIMTPDQRGRWTFKMNLDGLLRGDSATQFRNAVLARTAGTHSTNDLREGWFGLPRIPEDWADNPREPLNSNRAADSASGGMTAPQDQSSAIVAALMDDTSGDDDAA
jgi:HK97 family phage portal protein